MPCSNETFLKLFYNVSSSFQLLLLFFYLSSILVSKLLHSLSGSIRSFQRSTPYLEGEEKEAEELAENGYIHGEFTKKEDLVADIVCGGESLLLLPIRNPQKDQILDEDLTSPQEAFSEEDSNITSLADELEESIEAVLEQENVDKGDENSRKEASEGTAKDNVFKPEVDLEYEKVETNFIKDGNFFIFQPPKFESMQIETQEKDTEAVFGESLTVGSTSKSSSEWRSSIRTDDPFSSSSRRSCPKWESYTVFQKYDEEMLFLDRISAQKLHETESLRSIKVRPRSISQRIVHKLAARNEKSWDVRRNPYHELEGAYVAQICLTWEALNWNYKSFQSLRASRRDFDPGCSGQMAQQFQQFQVLLQRYIENEPYEHGRRPEVYARIRHFAPKLLQVPEFRDSEGNEKEEGISSKISSASFLVIMEDGIRTFMNFLKADKESHCQILAAFFKRNHTASVDHTLLHLVKKGNSIKYCKLKDLLRTQKCLRKRNLKAEEQMEILMGMIDAKVVARVLRMCDINEEQLHWCEEKMNKVRVREGKLHRDSSPLFFPAH